MYKKIKLNKNFELKSKDYSIVLIDGEVEVINYYNTNKFIYVFNLLNEIIVSDNVLDFNLEISKDNIARFIDNVSDGALPVFNKNLISLPHGYALRFNLSKLNYRLNRYKTLDFDLVDPVACLEGVLIKYVKNDNIAVSFSGGLDSTSILYACKEKFPDKKIVAFNWWNRGCSNNDFYESEKICKKLGVELIKIEIDPDDLIGEINLEKVVVTNYPSPYLIFINYIIKYIDEISRYFGGSDFVIINGTGGDHLFMESIPLDYICNLDFKSVKKISNIYSVGYFFVFYKYIKMKLSGISFDEANYREKMIYESLCQTSTHYIKGKNFFFFPFSTEEMIECSSKYRMDETFDHLYFRNHFRVGLENRYLSKDFYRINKGSMTGAYQKKLFNNRSNIEEMLKNGFLVKNNIISIVEVFKLLHFSSIGVGGIHPKLIIPIIFELMLVAHKRNGNEVS